MSPELIPVYGAAIVQLISTGIVIAWLKNRNTAQQKFLDEQKALLDGYRGYIETIRGYTDLFDIDIPRRFLELERETLSKEFDKERSELKENLLREFQDKNIITPIVKETLDESMKEMNIEFIAFTLQFLPSIEPELREMFLKRWFPVRGDFIREFLASEEQKKNKLP